MNRKRFRKLQASFAKRGGLIGLGPEATPEVTAAFLEELLSCPDCRAAILEACNGEDARDTDIDAVLRGLVIRGDH